MDVSGEVREPVVQVSVIVAVKNGAATLEQCIESVLAQDGCSAELIIVDAMSTDGTDEIVARYGDRITRYVREADRGITHAWNKALREARGRWCLFLGADDALAREDALRSLVVCALTAPQRPVLIHGGVIVTGNGVDRLAHPTPRDARAFLRLGRPLPHQGTLHDVDALRNVGGFDEAFAICADHDAAIRLASCGAIVRCPSVVAVMSAGGVSQRAESRELIRREQRTIVRRELGDVAAALVGLRNTLERSTGTVLRRLAVRVLGEKGGMRSIAAIRRRLHLDSWVPVGRGQLETAERALGFSRLRGRRDRRSFG